MIQSDLDILTMGRFNKGELRPEELTRLVNRLLADEKFYKRMKGSHDMRNYSGSEEIRNLHAYYQIKSN